MGLADVLRRTLTAINDNGVIREAAKAQEAFNPEAESIPRGQRIIMAAIQDRNSVLTTSFEILTDQTLNFRYRWVALVARGDEQAANEFLWAVESAIQQANAFLPKK